METKLDNESQKIFIQFETKASPEKVFKAMSEPEQLKQWMGPGEVFCQSVSSDPKPGGSYRIEMKTPDGVSTAYGKYHKVDPYSLLEYDWQWENGTFTGSLVSIQFTEIESGTRVEMVHSLIADDEKRAMHTQGWAGCFEKLIKFLDQ